MTWVKVEDTFPDHPKVLGLSDAALACWLRGLCYSSRHLTDGHLPAAALRVLGTSRATAELVTAGLWESVADGWRIHGYEDHQRSRSQVEKVRESARARARSSRELRANTRRSSREVTQPESESESESRTDTEQNVVSLSVAREADPQPVDDDDKRFNRVLESLVAVKVSRANGTVKNPAAYRRTALDNARLEHGGDLRQILERFPGASDDVLVAELLGEPSGLDRGLSWQA